MFYPSSTFPLPASSYFISCLLICGMAWVSGSFVLRVFMVLYIRPLNNLHRGPTPGRWNCRLPHIVQYMSSALSPYSWRKYWDSFLLLLLTMSINSPLLSLSTPSNCPHFYASLEPFVTSCCSSLPAPSFWLNLSPLKDWKKRQESFLRVKTLWTVSIVKKWEWEKWKGEHNPSSTQAESDRTYVRGF